MFNKEVQAIVQYRLAQKFATDSSIWILLAMPISLEKASIARGDVHVTGR